MAELDRDRVIACLEALGGDDDAAVLAAARDLHGQVSAAGADWHDLLHPDHRKNEDHEPEDKPAPTIPIDSEDDLAIIDALLARPNLFEGTRIELEGYKEDIAAGDFNNDDKKYLRALAARLGG